MGRMVNELEKSIKTDSMRLRYLLHINDRIENLHETGKRFGL